MSLSNYKLTDSAIAQKGVVAAPDKLTGTAAQNKAVFDRLIRESVKELFNGLIDTLASEDGAAEVGTTAITGVTGGDYGRRIVVGMGGEVLCPNYPNKSNG